jgi:predicted secreted Zn-dependent protease
MVNEWTGEMDHPKIKNEYKNLAASDEQKSRSVRRKEGHQGGTVEALLLEGPTD